MVEVPLRADGRLVPGGVHGILGNVSPLLPEALEWTVWVMPGVLGGVGIAFWVR